MGKQMCKLPARKCAEVQIGREPRGFIAVNLLGKEFEEETDRDRGIGFDWDGKIRPLLWLTLTSVTQV
jgi:hypothetical protein